METASTMRDDEALRREFSELVEATQRATAKLVRPWKIATAVLVVAVVLLADSARKTQKCEHKKEGLFGSFSATQKITENNAVSVC